MNNFDFNAYDDVTQYNKYDGFFAPNGCYYKVKLRNAPMNNDSHNKWAEKFMVENAKNFKFTVKQTDSFIYSLTKFSGPAEILVHYFGYVYYSHDPVYHKPIILLPDPKVVGKRATEEQLDSLFSMMLMNNENPYNNPVFMDEDAIRYNGAEDIQILKK